MEIAKNIRIIDLSLYLVKEKALIISDLHLGLEEAMNKQGYLVPRFQLNDIKEKLKKILENTEINEIIFNGDLKHEFGNISATEWNNIINLMEFVGNYCKNIIIIKGNHDILLEPIARKLNIKIQEYIKINEYFISHGDKIIDNLDFHMSKTTIIGNEHAAISIKKSGRREVYKCFLLGKYKDKTLIAMPSFNPMIEGNDILKEELLSPMLKQDLSNFRVFIAADKIYDFGTVRNLETL